MQQNNACKRSVLVIEDDMFLAHAYQLRFESEGIDTAIATTGNEVLPMLQNEPPGAVVLDLVLPGGMDGFTILETMKKTIGWTKVPVIVVSNLSQDVNMMRAKQLGADKYIVKADTRIGDIISITASHFC